MKIIFISLAVCLTSFVTLAQNFTISPDKEIHTNLAVNDYLTVQIDINHAESSELTLGWEILEKTAPEGWDYSFCDYNTCYDGSKTSGTMAPFTNTETGFIKVNISTNNESWCYFKFRVFDTNKPEETDTIQFWFEGTTGLDALTSQPFKIYPNPVNNSEKLNFSQNTQLKTCVILNQMGQVIKTQTLNSTNGVISIEGIKAGLYIVQLENVNGTKHVQNLVIK
jgi:hypothetical protein